MLGLKSKSLKTELYRKAVHLSSLWMPVFIMTMPRNWSIILFSFFLIVNFLMEYASYQKTAIIGSLFRKMFIKTLRNREISHSHFTPSGSIYILAAALTVSVCFTPKAAATAMCIVLISDTCAALFGKFCGTFRFYNGKSFEGTFAFILSAYFVIYFFFPAISSFFICFIAFISAATEFFEKEIGVDDNFSIPLVSGFFLNLIA